MFLPRARGIVCVVTARHRLAPGMALSGQQRALVAQAKAAADAGVDLLQLREPDMPDSAFLNLIERVKSAVCGAALRVLVNDRVDLAIAGAADGVHLKTAGIPVADARRLSPRDWLVGLSAHAAGEMMTAAGGADYVIFGTVFATPSKPEGQVLAGLPGLAAAVRASRVPVLAIGGIDELTVRDVAPLAAGIAAIGLFSTTEPRALADTVRKVRDAFDSVEPVHLH